MALGYHLFVEVFPLSCLYAICANKHPVAISFCA